MGILRIYLALCVVAAHSNKIGLFWPMHTGHEAVQVFFMISGFYMELVYEKYRSAKEFYLSRALRIFLPYWSVVALLLIVSAILGATTGNWAELTPYKSFAGVNGIGGVILTAISNVTIFFQDAVMFLKDDGGGLAFAPDFRTSAHPLWYYLFIPQAWSVSVELQFYMLVPLLAKLRSRWLLGIVCLATAGRIFVYQKLGWKDDPWTYRFSGFEIGFFVLGMLACRSWKSRQEWFAPLSAIGQSGRIAAVAARFGAVLFLCLASKLVVVAAGKFLDRTYVELVFAAAWALILPALFSLSRFDRRDRWVGELSYPVYLVHYFIIGLLMLAMGHPELANFATEPDGSLMNRWTGTLAALLSVGVAAALNHLWFDKLERLRHRKLAKA